MDSSQLPQPIKDPEIKHTQVSKLSVQYNEDERD